MSTAHIPEPRGNTSKFNIDWTPASKTLETIKWVISKEKYRIYHGLCTRFILHEIIPHCLMVIHKIDGQVGHHDNKKLQSYKQVLPRTLSIPLVGVWQQVVVEYNEANVDEDESLASFAKTLKAFCACHSTEDDQHELVSVICYAQKPEHMKVVKCLRHCVRETVCANCLKELNDYVNWLPGDKPALSEAQLNLAFIMECQVTGMFDAISRWLAHTMTRRAPSLFSCART
jgi:hypothetical protein